MTVDLAGLNKIRADADEGHFSTARLDLDSSIGSAEFSSLASDIRASFLRARARVALRDNDLVTAEILSSQAKLLEDSDDQRVLESSVLLLRGQLDEALAEVPTSGTNANLLRATILYLMGRQNEAQTVLLSEAKLTPDNADIYRQLAILSLANHDYASATKHANQAFAISPRHFKVRLTLAIVNYYACTPEDLIPRFPDTVPEPLPDYMLNLDRFTRLHLNRAIALFLECAATLDPSDFVVPILSLWRLACLSVDSSTRNRATELAESLIGERLADAAVQWVVRYNLGVNIDEWIDRTSVAIARHNATPEQRRLLAWVLIERGDADRARALLRTADVHETEAERISRKLMLSRTYANADEFQEALAVLENERDPQLDPIRKMLNDEMLASRDATSDRFSNDGPGLLARVARAASDRDWQFVVSRIDLLMTRFKTPPAVRLSLLGLYNTKRFAEFLRMYDEEAHWSGLDTESSIRLAYSSALWNLGRRAEAAAQAKLLFDLEKTATSGDLYGRLLFESGDLESIAVVSRLIRGSSDLTPEVAMRFAVWLQDSNPQDAAAMWDCAMHSDLGDDMVSIALTVADKIGRGPQTEPLIKRMQALAERGTGEVTLATLEQVIDLNTELEKNSLIAGGQYRFGAVPIHIVADFIRVPLFVSHLLEPTLNRARRPDRWVSVYVRSGSRGPLRTNLPTDGRLVLDTTSLFTCDLLGVLPTVTRQFKKVIVTDSIFGLLTEMKDRILPVQPHRLEHIRHIVETVEKRGIKRIPTQDGFVWARANNGFFVTNLPPLDPRTGGRLSLTDDMKRVGLNLSQLTAELVRHGNITPDEREKTLTAAGTEGKEEAIGAEIPRRADLLCTAVTLEQLDEGKLIALMLRDSYRLSITEQDYEFLKRQVEDSNQRVRFGRELERIRQVTRDGLATGDFELASAEIQPSSLDSNARSVAVLLAEARAGDLLTIDDRFCNSKTDNGKGALVCSTFDLLASLNSAGVLADKEYYRALLDARRSGLYFVPVSAHELQYHLDSANEEDGTLIESRSLRDLRHYIGGCLSIQAGLRVIAPDDEASFLHGIDDSNTATIKSKRSDAVADYVVLNLHAAELSAIRKKLDEKDYSALSSLNQVVKGLQA